MNDTIAIVQSTFMSGDLTALGVAVVSVLIAVGVMQRGTQIGSITILALLIFAVGCIARGFYLASQATAGTAPDIVGRLEASYLEFANLQAGTLLAYFLGFMAILLVLFALKSLVTR